MKKLLNIALVSAVIYGVVEALVVVFQENLFQTVMYDVEQGDFIIPIPDIVGMLIHILLVVVFWNVLQRAKESEKQVREIAAIAVFSIMLIFGTAINNIFMASWRLLYAKQGVNQFARYSVLQSMLEQGAPIIKFSMLLLIIYAAVMLGRKEK